MGRLSFPITLRPHHPPPSTRTRPGGRVRAGRGGWSVCGAPRALGESIVYFWGDALGLAYVGVRCPDSSIGCPSDQPEPFSVRNYRSESALVGVFLMLPSSGVRSSSRTT